MDRAAAELNNILASPATAKDKVRQARMVDEIFKELEPPELTGGEVSELADLLSAYMNPPSSSRRSPWLFNYRFPPQRRPGQPGWHFCFESALCFVLLFGREARDVLPFGRIVPLRLP
jgi:hypothetical protein